MDGIRGSFRRHGRYAVAAALGVLATAPSAAARVAHTVERGETLWSIAAASNLTTRALAAANGLPVDARVVAGRTIWVPSVPEGAGATGGATMPRAVAPRPMGAYVVRPGDSLSAIAARSGLPMRELAGMNGLDPRGTLLIGTPLTLSTGGPVAAPAAPAAPAQPVRPRIVAVGRPRPTPEWVTPSQVEDLALEHGVDPALAAGIARQESGFNNGLVSRANARGVMQILPSTWDFIQRRLAGHPLSSASALENVHAGVMYLGHLLRDTGGNEQQAAAGYYQGLRSVRRIGMLPSTRRYVADVMAQRARFGP